MKGTFSLLKKDVKISLFSNKVTERLVRNADKWREGKLIVAEDFNE